MTDPQWKYCEICAYGIRDDGKTPGSTKIGSLTICSDCLPSVTKLCLALLETINAAAEADMLRGNPISGAHHRAIEAERERLNAVLP